MGFYLISFARFAKRADTVIGPTPPGKGGVGPITVSALFANLAKLIK